MTVLIATLTPYVLMMIGGIVFVHTLFTKAQQHAELRAEAKLDEVKATQLIKKGNEASTNANEVLNEITDFLNKHNDGNGGGSGTK
jgi:hypothetical protein